MSKLQVIIIYKFNLINKNPRSMLPLFIHTSSTPHSIFLRQTNTSFNINGKKNKKNITHLLVVFYNPSPGLVGFCCRYACGTFGTLGLLGGWLMPLLSALNPSLIRSLSLDRPPVSLRIPDLVP